MVQAKQETMSSRDKILAAVKTSQPDKQPLPDFRQLQPITFGDAVSQFTTVLQNIGGSVVTITSLSDITNYVREHFEKGHNLVTTMEGIEGLEQVSEDMDPHDLETVELAVLPAVFGVAENGAVWLTEKEMKVRVLPFITQHLAIVLRADSVLANMHEAYERIGHATYGFSAFIAGPSKTADIEQSLVLGAHGARTMTLFLMIAS